MNTYRYLNILAEGQAEREFAQQTLNPYFLNQGIIVDARCAVTSKKKNKKGGLISYQQAKNDLLRYLLKESFN
jgi:uncharacterized protein (DUF2164 family)